MNITQLDRLLFYNIPGDVDSSNGYRTKRPALPREAFDKVYKHIILAEEKRVRAGKSSEEKDICPNGDTCVDLVDQGIHKYFEYDVTAHYNHGQEGIYKFPPRVENNLFYYDENDQEVKQGMDYFHLLNVRYQKCGCDASKLGGSFGALLEDLKEATLPHKNAGEGRGIFTFLLRSILPVIGALCWLWVITKGMNAGADSVGKGFLLGMLGIAISFFSWFAMFVLPIPVLMGFVHAVKGLFPKTIDPTILRQAYYRAMFYVRFRALWYQKAYNTDQTADVLKDMEDTINRTVAPWASKLGIDRLDHDTVSTYLFDKNK